MKRLVFITDHYPYTQGESSFVLPELSVLTQYFQVEIVCKSPEDKQRYQLPYDIPVYHYQQKVGKREKVCNLFRCLFHMDYYRELWRHKGERTGFKIREAHLRNFYFSARKFQKYMREQGIFREYDNTIYYSFWYNYGVYALALEKKRHPEMKLVTRAHGYDLYEERSACGFQPYKREMDAQLNLAVFACQAAREYYLKHFAGGGMERYPVSYLGVPDRGVNQTDDGEVLYLFSCSNLIPLKRVDKIIEALALTDGVRIHWTHAGGGESEEEIHTLAQTLLGEKDSVTCEFLGAVENSEVISFYKNRPVDLFLMASSTEGGSPVSIMEAFSFGVPAVGTSVGGISEMITEGTGYLLPADAQPKEITEAILRFAGTSKEEKMKMRAAARSAWQEHFNDKKNHMAFAEKLNKL